MIVRMACFMFFVSTGPLAAAQGNVQGVGSTSTSTANRQAGQIESGSPSEGITDVVAPLLSSLLVIGGLCGSIWILVRKRRHETSKQPMSRRRQQETSKHPNWLWLMAFTTSIVWWVISAIDEKASENERLLSVSFWFFFISVYGAKSYRAVRNGYQFIMASLMGGIVATVLLGAFCDHVADDQRYRGRGMQGFVMQALSVGPFALTVWVWIVTSVSQSIEIQNQTADREPSVELRSE